MLWNQHELQISSKQKLRAIVGVFVALCIPDNEFLCVFCTLQESLELSEEQMYDVIVCHDTVEEGLGSTLADRQRYVGVS